METDSNVFCFRTEAINVQLRFHCTLYSLRIEINMFPDVIIVCIILFSSLVWAFDFLLVPAAGGTIIAANNKPGLIDHLRRGSINYITTYKHSNDNSHLTMHTVITPRIR